MINSAYAQGVAMRHPERSQRTPFGLVTPRFVALHGKNKHAGRRPKIAAVMPQWAARPALSRRQPYVELAAGCPGIAQQRLGARPSATRRLSRSPERARRTRP